MVGMWSEYAQTYLLVVTVFTVLAFSLLLFFKPLLWARLLRWQVPAAVEDTHLAVYFGRCLGAFALVTNAMFLQAVINGRGLQVMLEFFTLFCALMVVVHIWGAIKKIQPITETLETGFWLLLLVLNLLVMPVG